MGIQHRGKIGKDLNKDKRKELEISNSIFLRQPSRLRRSGRAYVEYMICKMLTLFGLLLTLY